MYSENFKNMVNSAFTKSKQYYSNDVNFNTPNPYYIGFGNPNAKILILGKEKGFETFKDAETKNDMIKNIEQLKFESIENPNEWKHYVDNDIYLNHSHFYDSTSYINAFRPYSHLMPAGHTWTKYFTLLKRFYPKIDNASNGFLNFAFISEINFIPSKLSKIKTFNNPERIDFLKNEYFKSFPIIIGAFGDYLQKEQIQEIFDVKFESDSTRPKEKLIVFKNKNRILINTRQLSMNIKNEYFLRIAEEVKDYLPNINI